MNRYRGANAFRQALEERLRQLAPGGVGALRKRLGMERLLVRLQAHDPRWVLKGGLALQLRLKEQARTTRDIDLGTDFAVAAAGDARSAPAWIAGQIESACEKDSGDYFRFVLPAEAERDLEIEGVSAYRYSVVAELAGRVFDRFQLDVALDSGGPTAPEEIDGSGLLAFAGLPVERFLAVSLARHLAEKLHALTRPREAPTRVKDLLDVLLIERTGLPPADSIAAEIHATFEKRGTHPVPTGVPQAPASWASTFEAEARRTGLGPMTLEGAAAELHRVWKDLGLEES